MHKQNKDSMKSYQIYESNTPCTMSHDNCLKWCRNAYESSERGKLSWWEVQAGDREVKLNSSWNCIVQQIQEKYRSYIQKIKERLAVLNPRRWSIKLVDAKSGNTSWRDYTALFKNTEKLDFILQHNKTPSQARIKKTWVQLEPMYWTGTFFIFIKLD